LWLLSTGAGTWALTGYWGPFTALSSTDQQAALRTMSSAHLTPVRTLFTTFKGLTLVNAYGGSYEKTADGELSHWAHKALGYAGGSRGAWPRITKSDSQWTPTFLDVSKTAQLHPEYGRVIDCDVVIVGSGAGGGVIAGLLAQAGHSVIVVEQGKYTHPADLCLQELRSYAELYHRSGGVTPRDCSIRILAGKAFGGGTYVNWSASLIPPHDVRKEWATRFNLPHFLSRDYQASLDAVTSRAGVGVSAVSHNVANQILIDACKKLGYDWSVIPQNTAGQAHECGYCTFGCPYGIKQGTHQSWLKDAANAGARFIQQTTVNRVLHKHGRTIGVLATVQADGQPLFVRARKVVASAGALHTPALLLRSGLTNPNIGRNLRLHPATLVYGVFPSRLVESFKGSIMTVLSRVADNLDGSGYGAKLEISASHAGSLAVTLPWRSAAEHKRFMALESRLVPMLVLVRDYDSVGTVKLDPQGDSEISWALSKRDARSIAAGLEASIDALIIAGATEIITCQQTVPAFKVVDPSRADPFSCPAYKRYVASVLAAAPVTSIFSAHQMGTARMGASPSMGACDPTGETWEVKGLYCGDGSLLPTASGV
ncbi:GMC oxidoreductase-domain-containing protein, partial [Blyttiomyces helicus]